MKHPKINTKLILLLTLGFIFRLTIVTKALNPDLITQAGWGQWIYEHGWFGFYENKTWIYAWPNHPPLISILYGLGFKLFELLNTLFTYLGSFIALNRLGASKISFYYSFISWFSSAKYLDTPFVWGHLISLKLIPIFADIILAFMIYKFSREKANQKISLIITALYLFSPFSWYESALWGQNDQIGVIFLLLSFWFLTKSKITWLGPVMLVASIALKPTALIFCPLYLWFSLKDKRRFIYAFIGGVVSVILYAILVKLSSSKNIITFSTDLWKIIFIKGEVWTWINSFNFWRLITGFLSHYHTKFIGITYQAWGYFIYAILNIYAFYRYRARDWQSALKALFVVSFAGWLFIVTMHERYLFAAIITGLILSSQNIKILKYWLVLSIIFAINMFYGWWTPEIIWLKNILTWNNATNSIIPKILSLINLFIFFQMLKLTSKLVPISKKYRNSNA